MNLMRYDALAERVALPAQFRSDQARLVPGGRYDPKWLPPGSAPGLERNCWHWPVSATPMILRVFPGVETGDPLLARLVERSRVLNAARAVTMDHARQLAARFGSLPEPIGPLRDDGTRPRLREHQVAAVKRALAAGGSRGLFHKTGTGKTLTAGWLLQMLTRPVDGFRVSAVIAPVTPVRATWISNLEAWFPDLPFVNLRDFDKGKRLLAVENALRQHGRIVILTNFESVWTDPEVRKALSGAYVVCDEISKAKNHKSNISQALISCSPTWRGCVLLSGTPAPNGNHEYWPHAKLLACPSGYDAFPGSVWDFNRQFCHKKTFTRRAKPTDPCVACATARRDHAARGCAEFKEKEHYAGMEFDDTKVELLHERLAPVCEWLKKEECVDLPPKVFDQVRIDLDPATERAYLEMQEMMVVRLRNKYAVDARPVEVKARNGLAQMMRLRQITAGFVPVNAEEWLGATADTPLTMVPLGREKIEWTIDKVADTDDRMVVWTQFIFEADRYVKELKAAKIKCASITGATPERDRPGIFKQLVAGDIQVLVAHPGVAKWSVSFPGVSLSSYASVSANLEEFTQSQDRIHGIGRGSETVSSTYYLLTAYAGGQPTFDQVLLNILNGKNTIMDLPFVIDADRRRAGFVPRDVGERIGA